jgi:hypothetical protein
MLKNPDKMGTKIENESNNTALYWDILGRTLTGN